MLTVGNKSTELREATSLGTSVSSHFGKVNDPNLVQGKVWEHMAEAGGTLAAWTSAH